MPLLKLSSLIWRPSNSHTPEAGADACSFQVGLHCLLCSRPVTRQVSAKWRRKHSLGCWEGPTHPGSTGPVPGCQKTWGAPGGWESRGGRQGWVQCVIYNRRTSADVGSLWLQLWVELCPQSVYPNCCPPPQPPALAVNAALFGNRVFADTVQLNEVTLG